MKDKGFTFDGFETANTTPVPDALFDDLLGELTGTELKVLLYIIRRTRGFQKETDAISLTQFQKGIITKDGKVLDKGCGISDRQSIIKALASLKAKKCISQIKDKTTCGDYATCRYHLTSKEVVGNTNHMAIGGSRKYQPPTTEVVGNTNQGSLQNLLPVVGNTNHGVVGNTNLQETVIHYTDKQETERQEESVSANASHSPSSSSSSQDTSSLEEKTSEPEPAASSQPEVRIATETATSQDDQVDRMASQAMPQAIIPPAIPFVDQSTLPAPKKPRTRSKKQASSEPLAPPARPGDGPWNVEKCLAWGDYFRGFAYPHSERSNSKSYQEREAARAILGRGKTEEKFVKLMCYMRGITRDREPVTDPVERSDWWPEHQPADIKHAHENWDKMSAEYKSKKAPIKPAVPSPSAPVPSTRNGVVAPLWQGADAAIHEAKAAQQAVLDEMAHKQKVSVGA